MIDNVLKCSAVNIGHFEGLSEVWHVTTQILSLRTRHSRILSTIATFIAIAMIQCSLIRLCIKLDQRKI